MFRFKIYSRNYECLSTDVKVTEGIENGSTLTEIDTGNEFIFSGTAWVPKIVKTSINGSLAKTVKVMTDKVIVAGATYTAPLEDMTGYSKIAGISIADASHTYTLNCSYSPDGVLLTIPVALSASGVAVSKHGEATARGDYAAIQIINGDTVSRTYNAWMRKLV
ncbi:hypothetical protein [Desulfosporosinus nitroreducens]|uniref:hypothetical protein n=1 Tax=Desulfosporosinus nitroreducens TaxID=2018668 RepID=UPI00207C3A07|nr:hypothetical protein [Desulfosporosinus nitroreducens]MCO1599812.1 hypothetical protein [Desulfosporosinus nitroreducens]